MSDIPTTPFSATEIEALIAELVDHVLALARRQPQFVRALLEFVRAAAIDSEDDRGTPLRCDPSQFCCDPGAPPAPVEKANFRVCYWLQA